MSPRIVVTDHGFSEFAKLSEVARTYGATLEVHNSLDAAEVTQFTQGAQVVMTRFAPVTRDALSGLAPDAVVVRYGIGYDNVDVNAAREFGVRVAIVPDYGVDTVADHTVSLMLCLARRINVYDRAVRTQGWINPADIGPVKALSESTLGLIGAGKIGLAVARRMAAFGCTIIAHDPFADPNELDKLGIRSVESVAELLAQVDIVSLHAPLTDATLGIINSTSLRLMKPSALLVNTARGGLVDTEALAEALLEGRIAGAALDVVDPEPLPAESKLWQTSAVITPHAAFYSDTSIVRLEKLAAEEAGRALAGTPLRCQVVLS
jgi:D-3-phosphoglycerate dehydrogenase